MVAKSDQHDGEVDAVRVGPDSVVWRDLLALLLLSQSVHKYTAAQGLLCQHSLHVVSEVCPMSHRA